MPHRVATPIARLSVFDHTRIETGPQAPHRLNRDYGLSRFGNTAYAREEIVAELTAVFLGQTLGFTAHSLELNASYLQSWLQVLKADKNAIFKHSADAQRAADYLIEQSEAGEKRCSAEALPSDFTV